MLGLITALVAQLPSIIELGVNVAGIIPEVKKGIDALIGDSTISDAEGAELHARVAVAEAAWAEQVKIAQDEAAAGKATDG